MRLVNANLRSSSYFIAHARAHCERCNGASEVIALALPPGHETQVDGQWQCADSNAFIFYIAELPAPIARRLLQIAPLFSRKHGEGHRNPYWANHCEHCGAMFSDDTLHCEPGGFMPSQPTEAESISLLPIAESFSADAAGYAFDPEFFSLIHRRREPV